MSEGPSDPDLLDLDDLPDTASIGAADPLTARIAKAVGGLGRWARRQASAARLVRQLVLAVIGGSGVVVVAIAGAIATYSAGRAEERAEREALRADVSELRAAIERVEERQWTDGDRWRRTDTATHASTEE